MQGKLIDCHRSPYKNRQHNSVSVSVSAEYSLVPQMYHSVSLITLLVAYSLVFPTSNKTAEFIFTLLQAMHRIACSRGTVFTMSIPVSVCPGVCLSRRLSVPASVCPGVCLSRRLTVPVSVYPGVCLSHLWYPPLYTSPMASSALQH